jgi:bilirubin oxidase
MFSNNGLYMFHCHNLIHEDHMMMATFNVTKLETLGYDNVEGLDDPEDPRFVAEDWTADAYSDDQIQGRLNWLGGLGAYNEREQIVSALAAYYSGNPNPPVETGTAEATATYGSPQWSGGRGSWSQGAPPSETQGSNQDWKSHRGGPRGWGNHKGTQSGQ